MNALRQTLTEAEKIQPARVLRELERRGLIERGAGGWQLVAGVELERFDDGGGVRARDIEKRGGK